MAFVYADCVKETTSTTGTGTINLAGASTGFRGFVAAIGGGNTCVYEINDGASNREIGIGTVTDGSPDTLSRDTVISNSLGTTAKINFGAGTKDVFVTVPGAHLNQSPTELTIATGAITLTNLAHTVDTEADAASDDLDTINVGPIPEGSTIALMRANAARKVYVTAAGNIAHPCLLSATRPTLFQLIGSTWYCLDAWVLLDEQTASDDPSLDFEKGIGAAYDSYELDIVGLLPATDAAIPLLRFSTDAGANYIATNYFTAYPGHKSDDTDQSGGAANSTGVIMAASGVGSAAAEGFSGNAIIHHPSSAVLNKAAYGQTRAWTSDATAQLTATSFAGGHKTTAAINAFQVLFDSGNVALGTVRLYGRRK